MSKSINISVNEEDKLIFIADLAEEKITIDYSTDVDFTQLISELTNQIDEGIEILTNDFMEHEDQKLELILSTISSIIEKYNDSLKSDLEEDDDLPFS